jgi:hypothetical protein
MTQPLLARRMNLITLVLPAGTDHTAPSHGTESFEPYRADATDPDSDWLVDVPDHVGERLMHNGGYHLPSPTMRRRLSGDMMPIIQEDGEAPFSLSYDGDSYESSPETMPNGARLHIAAIPQEAHADVLSVHPGLKVLSIGDYAAPKRGRKPNPEVTDTAAHAGSVSFDKPPGLRLEGGAVRDDVFPADPPGSAHPDGIVGPAEEAVRAKAEAEAQKYSENRE